MLYSYVIQDMDCTLEQYCETEAIMGLYASVRDIRFSFVMAA